MSDRKLRETLDRQRRERESREAQDEAARVAVTADNERARREWLAKVKRERDEKREAGERAAREHAASEEARFKAFLRSAFLESNPGATSEDFARIYPQLRDDYYRREMERRIAAEMAQGEYRLI
jgi:hypothetical protein